ncbi:hypothetical protein V6R85_15305 [Agrobacterium sp. CCNWLW32]|jgi:hypothetical protein|uniref:hypothetical protein n=1 Tax=Agrobacterium TaxID=357 RepID=UPI000DCFA1DA|nr:hypothetical protein [Agrobacterium tumefaciens]NTE68401.1 hypothetical protein [Agrobacterium tumefaciens]
MTSSNSPHDFHPVYQVGRADDLDEAWGIDLITGQKVASLVALFGAVEFHLERAIWKLKGIDPKGIRPETDGKRISAMIDMVEQIAVALPSDIEKGMLATWCAACRSGFTIRNNISHGVPSRLGTTLVFSRNPQWHGEQRKKVFGDFWADVHTLDLVRQSFATLLRVIVHVEKCETSLESIGTKIVLRALGEARSILGEFASQTYDPSFEKY